MISATDQPPSARGTLKHLAVLSLGILALVGGYYFIRFPIVVIDTDLWFHLDAGRYIVEHHRLPTHAYFSFIQPPRPWVDYAWLFQTLLYAIDRLGGAYGLILLRTVSYVGLLALIGRYLLTASKTSGAWLWAIGLLSLYASLLISRNMLIRPHLCTYLLMASFLFILEYGRRWAMLLPLLGIVWCNLHGVTYPFLLMITGAYVAEHALNRCRGLALSHGAETVRVVLPTVLAIATIYLTPHGARLVPLPFVPMEYASQFVLEMKRNSFGEILKHVLSFQVSAMTPTYGTLVNLALFAGAAAAIVSLVKRQARASHLILLAMAMGLLTKGVRFIPECALLMLPVLSANPPGTSSAAQEPPLRIRHVCVAGLCVILSIRVLQGHLGSRERYPFSYKGLPQGVCLFLRHIQQQGSILNWANTGGYIRWMVTPRYHIFVDMEFPFPFTDEDFYAARAVFTDPLALRKIVTTYHPEFISAPLGLASFRELITAYPDYVPVFFDDVEVLYADRARVPDVARRYELRGFDPFAVWNTDPDVKLEGVDRVALMRWLAAARAIYPEGGLANYLAARIYNEEGAFDRALPFANTLITNYPMMALGYDQAAVAMSGLQETDRALASYRQALLRTAPEARTRLCREIAALYARKGQYGRAYRTLAIAVDTLSPETSVEDIYQLASMALKTGRVEHAKHLFGYLYDYRVAPTDQHWRAQLKHELELLGDAPPDGSDG